VELFVELKLFFWAKLLSSDSKVDRYLEGDCTVASARSAGYREFVKLAENSSRLPQGIKEIK
jgi:hypothetical protein